MCLQPPASRSLLPTWTSCSWNAPTPSMTIPARWRFPAAASTCGETPVEAALREAEEETGVDPSGVEVLGALPELALARAETSW
jgi:hypothetical protein